MSITSLALRLRRLLVELRGGFALHNLSVNNQLVATARDPIWGGEMRTCVDMPDSGQPPHLLGGGLPKERRRGGVERPLTLRSGPVRHAVQQHVAYVLPQGNMHASGLILYPSTFLTCQSEKPELS